MSDDKDHIDFTGAEFHAPVVGVQNNHAAPAPRPGPTQLLGLPREPEGFVGREDMRFPGGALHVDLNGYHPDPDQGIGAEQALASGSPARRTTTGGRAGCRGRWTRRTAGATRPGKRPC